MPALYPLQIAVVGLGGIGSTFAFHLANTGHHNVTAVARPGSTRLAQLRRDQGIINAQGKHAKLRVNDALDASTPYDLVIVTLLAHQLNVVLPALKASAARCIQFMFNNFNPDWLRDAVGIERCAFGMPFVQATINQDGRLKATIGAMGSRTLMDRQRSVEVFNEAGLPAALEHNMPLWLRCHAPLCVAFETVSVIAVQRHAGAAWGEATVLARGVQECFVLIQRLGYDIYPSTKVRLRACPTWVLAGMLWGMSRIKSFRELLATGARESCELVDMMVAAASGVQPLVVVGSIQAMRPALPSKASPVV